MTTLILVCLLIAVSGVVGYAHGRQVGSELGRQKGLELGSVEGHKRGFNEGVAKGQEAERQAMSERLQIVATTATTATTNNAVSSKIQPQSQHQSVAKPVRQKHWC